MTSSSEPIIPESAFLVFFILFFLALFAEKIFLQTKKGDRFLSLLFKRTEKELEKNLSDSNIRRCFCVHFSKKRELLFIVICLMIIGISYYSGNMLLMAAVAGTLLGIMWTTDTIIASQEARLVYKDISEQHFDYAKL